MYRLFLDITTGGILDTIDATDDLVNWSDVDLSFKRQGIDGVIRSFSTAFQFAGESCSAIVDAFYADRFAADAVVRFELKDDYDWTPIFSCPLDFATLTFDSMTCEINAVDNSIAATIKARKSTKYQYNVSDLRKYKPLNYDRLQMISRVEYFMNLPVQDDGKTLKFGFQPQGYPDRDWQIPIYIKKAEIATPETSDFFDVPFKTYGYGEDTKVEPFFQTFQARDVHVHIEFSVSVDSFQPNDTDFTFFLAQRHTDIDNTVTTTDLYTKNMLDYVTPFVTIYIDTDYSLAENDELIFGVRYKLTNLYHYDVLMFDIEDFSVSYEARSLPVNCNLISLDDMLQALVNSMTENSGVTTEIVKQREIGGVMTDNDRLVHTYLLPADSARGLTGAQVYSSFNDFSEMMAAEFGFVPVIDEDNLKVSFMPRDLLFSDATRLTFQPDEVRDFELTIAQDLICSQVNVGYEKQDYDSVNGRDEFRFTDHYITGLTNTDNALDLISPYRADAYGIEFLVMKRGEDTTDNKSDEDIFLVDVDEVGLEYKLRRQGPIALDEIVNHYYVKYDTGVLTSGSSRQVIKYDIIPGATYRVQVHQAGTPLSSSGAIISWWNNDAWVSTELRGSSSSDYDVTVTAPSTGVDQLVISCDNTTGSTYSVTRQYISISGVISPLSMFNVQFAQQFMIEANAPYIAGITNTLAVSSVEGNQDVIIDGVSVMDDVTVTATPIFLPEEISMTVPAASLATAWDAEFEVTAKGYTFVTSLKDVRINVGREQAVTYTLLVKAWSV